METLTKVYNWVLGYKKMMTLYSKYNSSILESPDISGWKPGIWSNFIWNFFHSTSPLYIDVDYAKDSMDLQVWISNRNHNVEELKAQLTSVLRPRFELNAPLKDEPHWHRYGQYKSEDEVVKVLKELLPKLASMKS